MRGRALRMLNAALVWLELLLDRWKTKCVRVATTRLSPSKKKPRFDKGKFFDLDFPLVARYVYSL